MPPTERKSAFGDFTAPEAALVKRLDRSRYAGMAPAVAAQKLMEDYAAMRPLEPSTRKEKTHIFTRILGDLAAKGKDIATVDQQTLAAYRAFLQQQVDSERLSQNYAYNLVKDWNAMVSLLFGETTRPGEGLKVKGFNQKAKEVQHLDMEEIDAMIQALPQVRFQDETYREAARIFLELACASAGRWDSIGSPLTTFACVDHVAGSIVFREVKNKEEHQAVLTKRCLEALKRHEAFLRKTPHWKGPETPLLMGPRGTVVTYNWMRNTLHTVAALAGIRKPVTTHLFRKSVGTHMAKENPRLAREQLGITHKVFEAHYNQPNFKDRLDRRDLLMG
ncbi:MAG: site-specific integrase, partial [Halobacteriales archaeon]|nr:site-specific integrase [Halobacteriales archaeon]